jgi:hypothetical protein
MTGALGTLRFPGKDGYAAFIVRWGLFVIFVIIGQWSVLRLLDELWGRT